MQDLRAGMLPAVAGMLHNIVTPTPSSRRRRRRPVIYRRDPDSQVHALTYAEWAHLGYPTPTVV